MILTRTIEGMTDFDDDVAAMAHCGCEPCEAVGPFELVSTDPAKAKAEAAHHWRELSRLLCRPEGYWIVQGSRVDHAELFCASTAATAA